MGVSSAVNSTVSSAMIRNHVDPKDLKDPKMMTSISTLKTKRTLISTLETIRTLISTLKTTRTLISTLTLRTISQQREEREKRKEVPNSSKREEMVKTKKVTSKVNSRVNSAVSSRVNSTVKRKETK